jgi:hypothetical protein
MLFNKIYDFKGVHAKKVSELNSEFDIDKHKIFEHVHEIYQLAPIVGFLYNQKAELDTTKDIKNVSIFYEQIVNYRHIFEFNYQLIMLLDKENEPDFERRVDKAFREYGTEKAKSDEVLYESYVRGGVDKIYEKIIENASSPDEYLENLYNFMEEIHERYEKSSESIMNLCQLARK